MASNNIRRVKRGFTKFYLVRNLVVKVLARLLRQSRIRRGDAKTKEKKNGTAKISVFFLFSFCKEKRTISSNSKNLSGDGFL